MDNVNTILLTSDEKSWLLTIDLSSIVYPTDINEIVQNTGN